MGSFDGNSSMKKLNKSQQEVWDRLKYVPPPVQQPWSYSSIKPQAPANGSIYFDTTNSEMMVFDGCTWKGIK